MLLTKEVEFDINAVKGGERVAVKRYWDVGTVVGDKLVIPVSKLLKGSSKRVRVKCDFCGLEFETKYGNYTRRGEKSNGAKDACRHCRTTKTLDTTLNRYGVSSSLSLPEVKVKAEETNLERYGTKVGLSSPIIQDRVKKTMIERYGVANPGLCPDIANKANQTRMERYGSICPFQNDDVMRKSLETKSKNKSTTSKQESTLCDAIKSLGYECVQGFVNGRFLYDLALFCDGHKIDIEYDGLYWHKLHGDADEKRDAASIKDGWQVIRFQSQNGIEVPTKEQIKAAIDAAIYEGRELQIIQLAA